MRLEDVSDFLAKSGVTTRTGKRISKTKASFILSNPFYIGLFKYGGEIHEDKHEPIITKKLFYEAQEMLRKRGQPERKPKNEPQPFCGLISWASCGMMITAENKTKRQKNGNVHNYVYYRCTKKLKTIKRNELSLRSGENDWFTPFQNWLKDAQNLDKIASDSDLFAKKVCAKEIFGSHLLLGGKKLCAAAGGAPNCIETAWAALCAAHASVG